VPHTVPTNSRGGMALRHTGIPRDCAGVASARRERDAEEPKSWWARKVGAKGGATEGKEQGTSEAGGKETDKRHTQTSCREAGRATQRAEQNQARPSDLVTRTR